MNYSYYFNYDNYRDLKNKEFQVGINLLIDKERKIEENIKKIEINIKMNQQILLKIQLKMALQSRPTARASDRRK